MFKYLRQDGDVAFIKRIAQACGVSVNNVFICPGNHDVNRNDTNRNAAIAKIRENDDMSDFLKLDDMIGYDRFQGLYYEVKGEHYQHYAIYQPNDKVSIINIDSCLLSKDNNDVNNLQVCFKQLHQLKERIPQDNSLKIVIMHHGVQWLKPEDGKMFQHWLVDNHIDILYCGHNHAAGVNTLDETLYDYDEQERIPVRQFTCGACLFDNGVSPSFYIAELIENKVQRQVKTTLHTFQNSKWNIDIGALRTFPNSVNEYVLNVENSGVVDENERLKQYADKTYENIFEAHDDMAQDIKSSRFLEFFGLRGGTFEKEASKVADAMYENKRLETKLLISYPFSHTIEDRLKRVPEFQASDKRENQWRDIFLKGGILKDELGEMKHAKIRFHKLPLIFRLIITEQHLYMGFYENINSSKSRMYRFDKGTSFYEGFHQYFRYAWKNAVPTYPEQIPPEYSFLKKNFAVVPSLVINLTDKCNMNCIYCPDGGENLRRCVSFCHIDNIYDLMTSFKEECLQIDMQEKLVLRITGGEPLLERERIHGVLNKAKILTFKKIVLCTNGIYFKETYESNSELWDSLKNELLLKISLDTLNEDNFQRLTKTSRDTLAIVKENIVFAKSKGFRIELNTVSTNINVNDIMEIYEFARENKLIGIKVLTVNDFGNRVTPDNTSSKLKELAHEMEEKGYTERDVYLNDNKGIQMKRFVDDCGCTLTIVDHNNSSKSVTPTRTYSTKCQDCEFYPDSLSVKTRKVSPCATGIMSLTMRADGAVSFCRLREDIEKSISGESLDVIRKIVHSQMKAFRSCYHSTAGEIEVRK